MPFRLPPLPDPPPDFDRLLASMVQTSTESQLIHALLGTPTVVTYLDGRLVVRSVPLEEFYDG
jgi:hypothetical protein